MSVRAYASLVGASRLLVPSAPVGKWQPTVCGGLCVLRSAPSRLDRSCQLSSLSRAQLLQPSGNSRCRQGTAPLLSWTNLQPSSSQPLQPRTSAGLTCLLHLLVHSSSDPLPAVREREHPRLPLSAASASHRPRSQPSTAPPPAPPRPSTAFLSCPSQLDSSRLTSGR